jgi:hypothetical protein
MPYNAHLLSLDSLHTGARLLLCERGRDLGSMVRATCPREGALASAVNAARGRYHGELTGV